MLTVRVTQSPSLLEQLCGVLCLVFAIGFGWVTWLLYVPGLRIEQNIPALFPGLGSVYFGFAGLYKIRNGV